MLGVLLVIYRTTHILILSYCHSRFDLCLCSLDHLDHDAYIVIADSLFIYCNSRFLAVEAALKYKLNPRLCSLGHLENDAYFVIATYSIYILS